MIWGDWCTELVRTDIHCTFFLHMVIYSKHDELPFCISILVPLANGPPDLIITEYLKV